MSRRRAALIAAIGVVVGACSGGDDAGPPPRPGPTETTAVIDWSGVALAGVAGQTTTTIVETGTASIVGEVKGPAGPVVGATVRIERLVAGREIRTDVVTGPDGRYQVTGIPGGRYRLRAFLAPALAQTVPEVRFLTDETEHQIDLAVQRHAGIIVRADAAPKPPVKGDAVNLVATVSNRVVTDDGIVRTTPVSGLTVELSGLGRWKLRDDGAPPTTSTSTSTTVSTSSTTSSTSPPRATQSPTARTDGGGRVRWELRCDVAGDPGLTLKVPVTVTPPPNEDGTQDDSYVTVESFALKLPACVDPATTTTTTTTTTTPPSSTP